MDIRPATVGDCDRIAFIHQSTLLQDWDSLVFAGWCRDGCYRIKVLEEHGEVVGYYVLRVIYPEAEIIALAVEKPFRRKGYGTELLKHMQALAEKEDQQVLFLEVSEHNVAALALYERAGFVPRGVRKRYYTDGSDAIMMEKQLGH